MPSQLRELCSEDFAQPAKGFSFGQLCSVNFAQPAEGFFLGQLCSVNSAQPAKGFFLGQLCPALSANFARSTVHHRLSLFKLISSLPQWQASYAKIGEKSFFWPVQRQNGPSRAQQRNYYARLSQHRPLASHRKDLPLYIRSLHHCPSGRRWQNGPSRAQQSARLGQHHHVSQPATLYYTRRDETLARCTTWEKAPPPPRQGGRRGWKS